MRAGDIDLSRDWCEVFEVDDADRDGLTLLGGGDVQRRGSYAIAAAAGSEMRLRGGEVDGDVPRRVWLAP